MSRLKAAIDYITTPWPSPAHNYFKCVHPRKFVGIWFRVATEGPGIAVDAPSKQLNKALKRPQFKADGSQLEKKWYPLLSTLNNICNHA